MVKDTAPPHRFGPGYDGPITSRQSQDVLGNRGLDNTLLHDRTHSVGIRPHPHGRAIARALLEGGHKPPSALKDERPLIDKVHEATFTNPIGMHWFNDLYAIRTMLRKAKCFYLDETTSRMVADFSVAIAHDLESVRRLAVPPFPITWIDLNNVARLDRMAELGNKLTARASGDLEGPPVDRAGWLIYPSTDHGGFYMTYFCQVDQGIISAPLSYWWQCGSPNPRPAPMDSTTEFLQGLSFGVTGPNVNPYDAYVTPTPLNQPFADIARDQVRDMMTELAGEMRHLWGFLLALNATSQFGVEASMTDQPKHTDIRTMPNNKPLLPLEHKVLTLHLRKRWTAEKTTLRTITHHKMRWHEVRGHMRTLASGKIIPVKPHERGDKKLGVITKTYKVEK